MIKEAAIPSNRGNGNSYRKSRNQRRKAQANAANSASKRHKADE